MLSLPDVTLVAIFTVCHDLSRRAIKDCTDRVEFGDVKVFTDRPRPGELRAGPFTDLRGAGWFTTYEVPQVIDTSHALFIHWDSWVVNPSAWRPEFLEYDYVGAPWWYHDTFNVGNSGFCLRSKALLDFLSDNPFDFPLASPEDHVLCRHYRARLPQFKWAPSDLAWRFAFERTERYPRDQVFGFHGIFNWPNVMGRGEIVERLSMATDYVRGRSEYREMEDLMRMKWGVGCTAA